MGLADAYARALKALLPPSRLWDLLPGGIVGKTLLGCSDELARVDGRGVDVLDESDPRTTEELLPDWEQLFGLAATGTDDQRRALVVARVIRRGRFRPVDFQTVLAPVLGLAPADVTVVERTHAQAVAMGDAREIYRFFVLRNPALPGTYDIAAAQALANEMKPSHTSCSVGESVGFECDDPHSLCDRDLLGV